jgi:hypothetical protein
MPYKCLVLIYIFPEMKLRALVMSITELYSNVMPPNFHIYVSVSDFYIPRNGLPILLQPKKSRPILQMQCKNRPQIHECRKWERGRTVSILGIHKSDFRYSESFMPESFLGVRIV